MTPDNAKNSAAANAAALAPPAEQHVVLCAVRSAQRRLRVQAGLNLSSRLTPAIGGMASLILLFLLRSGAPRTSSLFVGFVALGLVALVFVIGFLLGPSKLSAALSLDRALGRQGQLVATFDHHRAGHTNGPYQKLLLAREIPALQAQPGSFISFKRPPNAGATALVAIGFVALLTVSPPPPAKLPPSQELPSPKKEQLLSPDEAKYIENEAQKALEQASSTEGRGAAQELLELVKEVSAGTLDRKEALQRAAALKSELENEGRKGRALKKRLEKRGRQLSDSALTEDLGKAMSEQRLDDAAEALRALAERLRDERKPLSKKELDELRESLERAGKERKAETAQASSSEQKGHKQLEEKRRRLFKKKQDGSATAADLEELERTERELERLDRRKKEEQKTLSELDRALAQAAQELAELQKDSRQKSSEFLDKAAKSLEQQAGRALTDKEKKELLDQIERLKERLRQQQKDKKLQKRLQEFQQRARGQRKQGPQGQPRTVPIPRPGKPQAGPGREGAKGQGSQKEQAHSGTSGKKPGQAHHPDVSGEATKRLENEPQAASAAAQDTGKGPTESETIASAAEEGFVAGHYEELYTEYHTVMEEVMEKESIPEGRKRHVERYFELIRPRENENE